MGLPDIKKTIEEVIKGLLEMCLSSNKVNCATRASFYLLRKAIYTVHGDNLVFKKSFVSLQSGILTGTGRS